MSDKRVGYYSNALKNMKEYREANGLTQQQVADALGIDRSTYAYYESGKTTPGFDTIDKLLHLFGINYSDLFSSPAAQIKVADNSSGSQSSGGFAALSKDEQALIIRFRLMTERQRRELLKSLGAAGGKSSPGGTKKSDKKSL